MLQTSPMRLDLRPLQEPWIKENLSLLHGCLLKNVILGPLGPFYCLQGGGGLGAKPSQLEAEPTEVLVPRMRD